MNDLTFGGYPISFSIQDDEVLIECKGVIGTLSQMTSYIESKEVQNHYFGNSKVKHYPNRMIRIDCLRDKISQVYLIYEQALKFKNEYTNNGD